MKGKGKGKRYTEAKQQAIVLEAQEPGNTLAGVAEKHKVSVQSLYRWADKFKDIALTTPVAKAKGEGAVAPDVMKQLRKLQEENMKLKAIVVRNELTHFQAE